MNYVKPLHLLICLTGIFFISFTRIDDCGAQLHSPGNTPAKNDSIHVDSFQYYIRQYSNLYLSLYTAERLIQYQRASDSDKVKRIEKLQKDIDHDSLARINSLREAMNDSVKKSDTAMYDSLLALAGGKIEILKKLLYGTETDLLVKQRNAKYVALQAITTHLKTWSVKITGSRSVIFNDIKYHLFVADLDSDMVKMHLLHLKKNTSLGNVKGFLELQNAKPLMITNAGMFTPSYEPEGLYIEENSSKKYNLDMGNSLLGLNFYLKPNGVFYMDNKNIPHIDSTLEFARIQKSGKMKIKLGTQSGPMLVINGRIHPAFTEGSSNRKIRSGVGIINNKKIIFAITMNESCFYDFAVFFRDVFHCKNALFLDGAISRMYLHDIDPEETGGQFGPIISVSRKIKK